MQAFDLCATQRDSLAIALKFAAYRVTSSEREGRELYRAAVSGHHHFKLLELIKQLDREVGLSDPSATPAPPQKSLNAFYETAFDRSADL